MFITYCEICGRPITVRHKLIKYCKSCRGSINYQIRRQVPYKKAVEDLKKKKRPLREKTFRKKTISEVVEISIKTGQSYGYTVASLEGRI